MEEQAQDSQHSIQAGSSCRHCRTGEGCHTDLWACQRAYAPYTGSYPLDFVERLYSLVKVQDGWSVCHLFSGIVTHQLNPPEVLVDLNPKVKPDLCEDATHTSLPDDQFDLVMADPPYNEQYASRYAVAKCPTIKSVLTEAHRITKPGGYYGALHFTVPTNQFHDSRLAVVGVTEGSNMRIRVLCVFQKKREENGPSLSGLQKVP